MRGPRARSSHIWVANHIPNPLTDALRRGSRHRDETTRCIDCLAAEYVCGSLRVAETCRLTGADKYNVEEHAASHMKEPAVQRELQSQTWHMKPQQLQHMKRSRTTTRPVTAPMQLACYAKRKWLVRRRGPAALRISLHRARKPSCLHSGAQAHPGQNAF